MLNNLQSYQIIFSMGFGCFLGTFLAYTANTRYQTYSELPQFDYPEMKDYLDNLFGSIPTGIFGGFMALAIGSVNFGFLESCSLESIFFYAFLISLFSRGIDTWLGVIKLIFSKFISTNNTN